MKSRERGRGKGKCGKWGRLGNGEGYGWTKREKC